MIFNLITNFVLLIFGMIFVFFPIVSISTIPVVGPAAYDTLSYIMGKWNAVMDTLPYLHEVWTVFILVIIPFEIALMVGKFFLGSRMPADV